jgi:LacI family transcriptional regulator
VTGSGKLTTMATIKEVARTAKVSVGTVSNVLRGSTRVNPAIRDRVDRAMKSLDYHPNQIARSLKTKQTHLLGMVISDITNPYFPRMVRGAEDAAIEHGYLLVTSNTDHQIEREKRVVSVLRNRRVDGILLVIAPSDGDTEHITNTVASGIPVVCLDRVPRGIRLSSVTVDAVRGAEMCVRHLVCMGHRAIGIITGPMQLQNAIDRLQGYRNILAEAGLQEDPTLIGNGDFRMESGYLLTKHMMLAPLPPTALFVSNGMMGMGALKALKELSLCCPKDVALAVFDELPGNESYSPGVTVVAQPEYEIGYRGAKMLIGQIENGEPAEPLAITLNAELRIRESTRLRFGTTRSDVR